MSSVNTVPRPSALVARSALGINALSAMSIVSPINRLDQSARVGRSPGSRAIRRSNSVRRTSIILSLSSAAMTSARIFAGSPGASRRQKSCKNAIVTQVQARRSTQFRPRVLRSNSLVGAMNGLIAASRSTFNLSKVAARVENRTKHSSATIASVDSVSRSVASWAWRAADSA
ncbi:unannotated protein [freshwater metagenome]|uniref:Unannotated protein n=1 Tax=freshwater metagenome TaxID=449393 RepID=A0A6J7DEZ5_9ZZZZ